MSIKQALPRCGSQREWQIATLLKRSAEWTMEDDRLVHQTGVFVIAFASPLAVIGHNDTRLFSCKSETLWNVIEDVAAAINAPDPSAVLAMDVVLKMLLGEEEEERIREEQRKFEAEQRHMQMMHQMYRDMYIEMKPKPKKASPQPARTPAPPIVVNASSWTGR